MTELTSFERDVLFLLLQGDSETLAILRAQVDGARVASRDYSGVGFFTEFEHLAGSPPLPASENVVFGDVLAEIYGLAHGAGFVLFIENGWISMLEGYSYGEPWPACIEHYTLRYSADERDLPPCLRA